MARPGRKRIFPEIKERRIVKIWQNINVRCSRPNCGSYKYYGGKGIENLLTPVDVEFLWNRDGAAQMKRPSIDRINNSLSYTVENCRFVELSQNLPGPVIGPRKPHPPLLTPKMPKSPLPATGERWDWTNRYFDVGDVISWAADDSRNSGSGAITRIQKNRFGRVSYWVGDHYIYVRRSGLWFLFTEERKIS